MIDVGQTVGNYNITAKLGEGGMGMVFLAEHPVIGRKAALKAIHPHLARSVDTVTRFVNEAKAINQIEHEHIVNITDFGSTPAGDCYFIMEHLEGEMLSDAIGRKGGFPPARALNIAAQIADALQASHEHGVIHRDLKPDNVFLITRDTTLDFVKVLDFGLAKLTPAGGATPTHNTGPGTIMGTPYYMSPEQCEGKGTVDHRADIYALGVILFEMLTGCVPFGGEGYGEVIIKHVTVRPPAARSLVPDLPPSIDALLSRALAKDPAHRFQSMADFREALLQPESYASAVPAPVGDDDLSGRFRAAQPAARTAMSVAPVSAVNTARLTPAKLAPSKPPASTLRHGAGEVVDDAEPEPKRNRGGLLLLGVAALTGVAVASVTVRARANQLLGAAIASVNVRQRANQLLGAAAAPPKPATVRVSFSSDPEGAIVARSDGFVLGVTPLSIEVPFSDDAVEYVVHKDGYVSKVTSFVPNLPLPVLTLLVKDEQPEIAVVASPVGDPPVTDAAPSASMTVRTHDHHGRRGERLDELDDDDSTLPPSAR